MRKLLVLFLMFFVLLLPVNASSTRAYQDYLYQYDTYRTVASQFQTAKNEYIQFQSLASQTSAYTETKRFLLQRNQLLTTYLLLLKENILQNTGISDSDKTSYEQIITNEINYFTSYTKDITNTVSLENAIVVSVPFEPHYKEYYRNVRRVLAALALGRLVSIDATYRALTIDAQSLIASHAASFPAQKQDTIKQWMDQILNKQNSYEKRYTEHKSALQTLDGYSIQEIDQKYTEFITSLTATQQYLIDGSSYLGELKQTLKYTN